MRTTSFALLSFALSARSLLATEVFVADFDDEVPPQITGSFTAESVNAFSGLGPTDKAFGGEFIRNASTGDPAAATVLTLTGLPIHESVDIGFLLGLINTWDGTGSGWGPDSFNVSVDGEIVFSEVFGLRTGGTSYDPPSGVALGDVRASNSSWGSWLGSRGYDMSLEPAFQSIPHSSSSLEVEFFASGPNYGQDTRDESWAIDNLQVSVNTAGSPPISPTEPEGGPIQWSVDEGGNGHYYELVKDVRNPSTFFEAKNAAEASSHLGASGQLVSITSREEQDFILNNVYDGDVVWIGLTDSELYGGMESLRKPDPKKDGWVWLTGEPVEYTNWFDPEPNNGDSGEDSVIMHGREGRWSDFRFGNHYAYIVEYDVEAETARSCNGDSIADILDADCVRNDELDAFLIGIGSLRGDFDGDGKVAFADFFTLANAFGGTGRYTQGDFDKDGSVTFGDFISFSDVFGMSASAAAVPEPTTSTLAIIIATVLYTLRARRLR